MVVAAVEVERDAVPDDEVAAEEVVVVEEEEEEEGQQQEPRPQAEEDPLKEAGATIDDVLEKAGVRA
jgi:hypothetical protein